LSYAYADREVRHLIGN